MCDASVTVLQICVFASLLPAKGNVSWFEKLGLFCMEAILLVSFSHLCKYVFSGAQA